MGKEAQRQPNCPCQCRIANLLNRLAVTMILLQLVAGLLGVEAGQDAIIRTEMYRIKNETVPPYKYTVADFSIAISNLRNNLSHALVDEGLIVPIYLGAENKTTGNILSADVDSLSYARNPAQVLETVYGTGDPTEPGGFYPHGGKGVIAYKYLEKAKA